MVSIAYPPAGKSPDGLALLPEQKTETVFMSVGGYLLICNLAGRNSGMECAESDRGKIFSAMSAFCGGIFMDSRTDSWADPKAENGQI